MARRVKRLNIVSPRKIAWLADNRREERKGITVHASCKVVFLHLGMNRMKHIHDYEIMAPAGSVRVALGSHPGADSIYFGIEG